MKSFVPALAAILALSVPALAATAPSPTPHASMGHMSGTMKGSSMQGHMKSTAMHGHMGGAMHAATPKPSPSKM